MKQLIAHLLIRFIKPKHSTLIDEDTITMGYGKLNIWGEFEYPIHPNLIKKILGANKWSEIDID